MVLAANIISGSVAMLFNETIDLPQLVCLRISERANDIQSATLALTRRLRVRSPQAFREFGSVSSREMCPLSHLEERGRGFESDLLHPAGSKGAAAAILLSFLSGCALVSLFATSGSEAWRVLPPPRKLFSPSEYVRHPSLPPPRPLPERMPKDCHRWALFGQPWAVFQSCLECGVVSHCSPVSIRSLKPESNFTF